MYTVVVRAIIETHPRCGYELVVPAFELHESLPAVLHRHERWDGTGYPELLAGADIPEVARIVAVADVWDALVSDRAYREGTAAAAAAALAQIAAGSGTHFDPAVVAAFLTIAPREPRVTSSTGLDGRSRRFRRFSATFQLDVFLYAECSTSRTSGGSFAVASAVRS